MNERITQLAKQAHVTVLTTKGMEDIVDGCYIVSPDKLEKFAELIVRECAGKVDWILAEGGRTQGDLIKQHFGVEE